MKPEELLKTVSLAGKILLESGAEIQRTEETVCRMCRAYGVEEASAFVIPTGMFLSFVYGGESYAKIMRIQGSVQNMERINQVNELSRRCSESPADLEEVYNELLRIQKVYRYSRGMLRLAGGAIAAFFTVFFGGQIPDAIVGFFVGYITQSAVQLFEMHQVNFIVKITCTSVIVTLLSLILNKMGLVGNLDSVIIGSLMLLVPGLAITNAVRDSIGGDLLAGMIRAVEAALIAVAIALGAGVTMSVWLALAGGVAG